jgi:sugar phosphate isomerase/epimerase
MRLGLEAGKDTHALAVELGIHGVPINAAQLAQEGVEATLRPLREQGLTVCQIGAFGFNPLNVKESERATLEQAIPLAAETGCPYIVINGGNYNANAFGATDRRNYGAEALDEAARNLAPLLSLADRHGARLSIEPILKSAVSSPERFLMLQQKVGSPALRINIDVTSLYDYWDLIDPTATVEHICTALAGHYGLAHVKEVALADGFHLHAGLAPLGAGATDWAQYLRLIAPHLPDDSWVILEHTQTPEETRSSVALLRDAANRAGVTLAL